MPLVLHQQPDDLVINVSGGCGLGFQRVNGVCVRNTTARHARRYERRWGYAGAYPYHYYGRGYNAYGAAYGATGVYGGYVDPNGGPRPVWDSSTGRWQCWIVTDDARGFGYEGTCAQAVLNAFLNVRKGY